MKLSQFEQREKARFLEGRPRFLRKRFKKCPSGAQIIAAKNAFADALEEEHGVRFAVTFRPFLGRQWTRTGFLFADPNWGSLTGVSRNAKNGRIVEDAYYSLIGDTALHPIAIVATGNLWKATGLTATELLEGIAWLWDQGKAKHHVNGQGHAIYMTMQRRREAP